MRRSLSRNLVVNSLARRYLSSCRSLPSRCTSMRSARRAMVWSTLTWTLFVYLGVLDFGLSRAAANALGRLGHASSRERSPVLVTALFLNLLFGLIASAVLYGVGGALLWRWFPLSGELAQEAVAAFPWMVPMLPIALLTSVAISALDSRERFLLSTTVSCCGLILGAVLPLISVVIFGPSLRVIIPAHYARSIGRATGNVDGRVLGGMADLLVRARPRLGAQVVRLWRMGERLQRGQPDPGRVRSVSDRADARCGGRRALRRTV